MAQRQEYICFDSDLKHLRTHYHALCKLCNHFLTNRLGSFDRKLFCLGTCVSSTRRTLLSEKLPHDHGESSKLECCKFVLNFLAGSTKNHLEVCLGVRRRLLMQVYGLEFRAVQALYLVTKTNKLY
jgi:hypothetical protein